MATLLPPRVDVPFESLSFDEQQLFAVNPPPGTQFIRRKTSLFWAIFGLFLATPILLSLMIGLAQGQKPDRTFALVLVVGGAFVWPFLSRAWRERQRKQRELTGAPRLGFVVTSRLIAVHLDEATATVLDAAQLATMWIVCGTSKDTTRDPVGVTFALTDGQGVAISTMEDFDLQGLVKAVVTAHPHVEIACEAGMNDRDCQEFLALKPEPEPPQSRAAAATPEVAASALDRESAGTAAGDA